MSSPSGALPVVRAAIARRPGRAGAATVLALAALLFSPFFLRGEVFLAADTLRMSLPWRGHAAPGFRPHNPLISDPINANYAAVYNAQLKGGGLAHWNPLTFTGTPATGVTSMMGGPGRTFPLKMLLHRLLPVTTAFMLLNFVYVCLMGLTMHAYLRSVGAGERGALFGAAAYLLNGYLMVWLEFESVAATAAFVPLLLLIAERYRSPRRVAAALAGAGVLGCVGLMGMIQYVIYTWVLVGAYVLFVAVRAARARGRAREGFAVLACFMITAAGAALIGAIEFLPARDLIGASSRIDRAFGFREFFERLGVVPWRYWVTLVFPDFFGSPVMGFSAVPRLPSHEYMNYNELCVYLGVPTLFALLACAVTARGAHSRFFLGLSAAVVAMLAGTAAYWPLFALVPGMDRMNPLRLIFVFSLAASAAAGLGVGGLEEAGPRRSRVFLALSGVLGAAVLVFSLVAAAPGVTRRFDAELLAQSPDLAPELVAEFARLRSPRSAVVARPLALTLASGALFGVFAAAPRRRALAFALLLALLAVDLIGFGWRYNTRCRPAELYPETPSIAFLRAQPGPFRVVMDAGSGFLANVLVPFGIEEVGGYSSFYPERAGRLFSYAEYGEYAWRGARFDRWVQFRSVGSPLLDIMNVRYVLTDPAVAPPAGARFRPVFRGDMTVWENAEALPRAYVVPRAVVRRSVDEVLEFLGSAAFDKRGQVVLEEEPDLAFLADGGRADVAPAATIVRRGPDALEVTASLPKRGWLVLADAWYPGWEATVDGRPERILRANANFRAVPLRAGTHRVAFAFRPPAVRWGRRLSAAGALLVVVGLPLALRGRNSAALVE